jgi:hypothetical protein
MGPEPRDEYSARALPARSLWTAAGRRFLIDYVRLIFHHESAEPVRVASVCLVLGSVRGDSPGHGRPDAPKRS